MFDVFGLWKFWFVKFGNLWTESFWLWFGKTKFDDQNSVRPQTEITMQNHYRSTKLGWTSNDASCDTYRGHHSFILRMLVEPFYDRKVKHWSVTASYVDWRKSYIDFVVWNSYNTSVIKIIVGATGTNRLSDYPSDSICWRPFTLFGSPFRYLDQNLSTVGRYSCDGPLLYNWRIYFYQYRGG